MRLSFGLCWDNGLRNRLILSVCVLSPPVLLFLPSVTCCSPWRHACAWGGLVMSTALGFNKQSFTRRSFCDLHPCLTRGVKRGDWFMARPSLEQGRERESEGSDGGKVVDLLSSPATKAGRECAYVNPLAERWSKTGTSWALLIASGQAMLSKQLGKCADEE